MDNNKQVIRLTEEDLHMLVNEAVNQVLIQEGFLDTLKGGAQAIRGLVKQGAQKGREAAARQVGKAYQGAKDSATKAGRNVMAGVTKAGRKVANTASGAIDKAKDFGDKVGEKAGQVGTAIQTGMNNQNLQAAQQTAIKSLNDFLAKAKKMPGVVGEKRMYAIQQALNALEDAGYQAQNNYKSDMRKVFK